ncbi:MAG: superoxide dismutase family protein [Sphingobium sp.]
MKFASRFFSFPAVMLIGGCVTTGMERAASNGAEEAPKAGATLLDANGEPQGSATLTEAAEGVHVVVKAGGLTPGLHAVHIHMTGVCTPPDFASAGGHWNPTGKQHGKDNPNGKHMGDMSNMLAGADGAGEIEYVAAGATIRGADIPLIDVDGAAIVIHAGADDEISDPAGNAGGRVVCGVVTAG